MCGQQVGADVRTRSEQETRCWRSDGDHDPAAYVDVARRAGVGSRWGGRSGEPSAVGWKGGGGGGKEEGGE